MPASDVLKGKKGCLLLAAATVLSPYLSGLAADAAHATATLTALGLPALAVLGPKIGELALKKVESRFDKRFDELFAPKTSEDLEKLTGMVIGEIIRDYAGKYAPEMAPLKRTAHQAEAHWKEVKEPPFTPDDMAALLPTLQEMEGSGDLAARVNWQSIVVIWYPDLSHEAVIAALAAELQAQFPVKLRAKLFGEASADSGAYRQAVLSLLLSIAEAVSPSHASAPRPAKGSITHPDFFRGRQDDLQQLERSLPRRGQAHARAAITGLGGMGKTTLAQRFAQLHAGDYDFLFWVNAESSDSLRQSYRAIAEQLRLGLPPDTPDDKVRDAVVAWLNTESGYLLLLNNADFYEQALDSDADGPGKTRFTLDDLLPYLPQGAIGGHILFTMRADTLPAKLRISSANQVRLTAMTNDAATVFLVERVHGDGAKLSDAKELAAVQTLVNELGGLPLALEQVAAYVCTTKSFAEYLALYQDTLLGLAENLPETGDYPATVATTWNISIRAVRARQEKNGKPLGEAAVALLILSAFLAPDAVPEEVVIAAAEISSGPLHDYYAEVATDAERHRCWHELLEPLSDYSLVRKYNSALQPDDGAVLLLKNTFSVHRLVQRVQRAAVRTDQDRLKNLVTHAVAKVFPDPRFDNWQQCGRLTSSVAAVAQYQEVPECRTDTMVALLSAAALYFSRQGNFREAEPLYKGAIKIRRDTLSYPHSHIAISLNNLALFYLTQGRYTEAERLFEEALTIYRIVLPYPHKYLASCLNNLAELYREQGNLAKAKPLHEEALQIRREEFSPPHKDIAISLTNLARLYKAQGDLDKAERLFQEALEIWRGLPDSKVDVVLSLANLAGLYQEQGYPYKAELLLEEALNLSHESVLRSHRDVAIQLNNLGYFYTCQGDLDKAEPLLKNSLEIRRQIHTRPHNDVASGLNNLAELYKRREQYKEAQPFYEEALQIRRMVFPHPHPDLAASLDGLATIYYLQGRLDEAEPLYEEALKIVRSTLGGSHPHTKAVQAHHQGLIALKNRKSGYIGRLMQGLVVKRRSG